MQYTVHLCNIYKHGTNGNWQGIATCNIITPKPIIKRMLCHGRVVKLQGLFRHMKGAISPLCQ